MTTDNIFHMRYFPGDFRLWDPKIASKNDKKQYLHGGKSYYLPFEHTICLSKEWNWFQKREAKTVRELDELEELFYWTTGNGNSLVVNIAPDYHGLIREHEAQTTIALGKRLGIEVGKPLPSGGEYIQVGAPTEASSLYDDSEEYAAERATDGGMQTRWASAELTPQLVVTLDPDKEFDKITIFEYCDVTHFDDFANRRVNRIQAYTIDRMVNGEWETIFTDDTPMGDCKTIRFTHPYKAEKIRLNVTAATAPPSIYEFNIINSNRQNQASL